MRRGIGYQVSANHDSEMVSGLVHNDVSFNKALNLNDQYSKMPSVAGIGETVVLSVVVLMQLPPDGVKM